MVFTKKSIRVVLASNTVDFINGKNVIDFNGLPIDLDLDYAGLFSTAKIRIYGLSKEHIDAITSLPFPILQPYIAEFYVKVFVDEGLGEEELFTGSVQKAVPNYTSAPDVFVEIDSFAGTFTNAMDGIPPTSIEGDVPAPFLFQKICEPYKVEFVNHDVEKVCSGSPRYDQVGLMNRLRKAAQDYNIFVELYNNTVHIWEHSNKVWNITRDDYIGYPTFNEVGIGIVLDKAIRVRRCDSFVISGSDVEPANARWHVVSVKYLLSTKIGGKWQVSIKGVRENVK